MNKNNIEKGLKAYYEYIIKREEIEEDILEYISKRINANQDSIEKLIDMTKEKIDMKIIDKVLKKESKYKSNKTFDMDSQGFVRGILNTPKGVMLKEESNIEKVVELYIDAILSRNAVIISDIEYSEISVKKLILEIIQIALEKFEVDKNLIQLLPYEEVNNDEFNKVTTNIVHNVLNAVLPVIKGANVNNQSIKLCDITNDNKLDEVEFNFNVFNEKLSNYCNGFVDLIFKNNDTYAILDWKSDKLNDDFTSYCDAGILKKHVDECYSIQRVLYSYCLIKTLKLQYENLSYQEIFENHFGGVYYVFLRGCNENTGNGVYCQTWNNWEDLEKSFIEITNSRIGGNHE